MKLQFRHQRFQEEAARAVVDVFAGQPCLSAVSQEKPKEEAGSPKNCARWGNPRIQLDDQKILENIRRIQRRNQITPSSKLEGTYNLTVEMETGVGKTYTYMKTMYELNRHYGWSKYMVVVPSIAVREGVFQAFQVTQEHFAQEYGKKIRFFVYQSSKLAQIDQFASDTAIHVMIINAQAFNARGKDARKIYMKLDAFRSRRPIDIIAETNPIVIIDEPQSVEGRQTKKNLEEFHPLMTLRYSATHRKDSIYNMVYRLDAMDAYNMKLVKKIAVKGIAPSGSLAAESYVYLEGIHLSRTDPAAAIQFECRQNSRIQKVTRKVKAGYDLYEGSGGLEEYRNHFIVKSIDGRDDSVEFQNGLKLHAGETVGRVSGEQLRRIQIRETILSHIERERMLFARGIKVLSLFFIDEVAHYRDYDGAGQARNGIYAKMFEEEYEDIVENLRLRPGEEAYGDYLASIDTHDTHAGYFSIDKKGRMVNSKGRGREHSSDDADAYDLIMKNKELLLDLDPGRSPVRFLFSHSALREGWDNPNVFQICTLKQSGSDIRRRQEVGRGMRLCVNRDGERMDENALGGEVHQVNVLTVIASESYEDFARGLQSEIAQAVSFRPRQVDEKLLADVRIQNGRGGQMAVGKENARQILADLAEWGYLDDDRRLTEKYYEDRKAGCMEFGTWEGYGQELLAALDGVYSEKRMRPENARGSSVELRVNEERLNSREFQILWDKISGRSVYTVDFDTDELVGKAVKAVNEQLRIQKLFFQVETGTMERISSKEELLSGKAFWRSDSRNYESSGQSGQRSGSQARVKYDLIGKLVEETGLTRRAAAGILTGIEPEVFGQFRENPEEFILQAAQIINREKEAAVISHIRYEKTSARYGMDILTESVQKGRPGVNLLETRKHLFDHLVYVSASERAFAEELEANDKVAVYVRLPMDFAVSTPAGNYTPGWAIVLREETGELRCCIADARGGIPGEKNRIRCAKEHFRAVSGEEMVYAAENYKELRKKLFHRQ